MYTRTRALGSFRKIVTSTVIEEEKLAWVSPGYEGGGGGGGGRLGFTEAIKRRRRRRIAVLSTTHEKAEARLNYDYPRALDYDDDNDPARARPVAWGSKERKKKHIIKRERVPTSPLRNDPHIGVSLFHKQMSLYARLRFVGLPLLPTHQDNTIEAKGSYPT